MKLLYLSIVVSCSILTLSSCGEDKKEADSVATVDSLLYVGTDTSFSSSNLYAFDLESRESQELPSKESGDFILRADVGRLMGFNRHRTSLNFREVITTGDTFTYGTQTGLPDSFAGDPSDFAWLDENTMLLAGYNSHNLHVVRYSDGEILQSLGEDFDVPGDGPFYPTDILRQEDNTYLVLHQGYNDSFTATTTGALFTITWDGTSITATDVDAETEGTQGVTLTSHLPSGIFPTTDDTYLIMGFCATWATDCTAAFETFQAGATSTTAVTYDPLSDIGIYGSLVQASNDIYYVQMQDTTDDSNPAVLGKINLADNTLAKIFDYSDVNDDNYADTGLLAYDDVNDILYVGEPTTTATGQIHTLVDDTITTTTETPAVPRDAVFVTSEGLAQ